jgi:hypothetical protein
VRNFLLRLLGRHEPTTADAPRARHPFGDVCQHGVQFLDQCDECPGGWQPITATRPYFTAVESSDVGSAYDQVARSPMPWSPEYSSMLERQDDADREAARPGAVTEPMHYAYVERTACGEDPARLLYTNDWDIVTCDDCLAARTTAPNPAVDHG